MKNASIQKKRMIIGVLFSAWLALMFSPIGNIVALVTICGLIVGLFALGCISTQKPTKKN